MKKSTRKLKAQETLNIIDSGVYRNLNNRIIDLEDDVRNAKENSKYYTSEALDVIINDLSLNENYSTAIEVKHEDSISSIIRLNEEGEKNIMCLNFASAKNPGGGFLNGALAQEESLAVSSSLYACQMNCFDFYQTHRDMKSCVYTDGMIYSPNVPVFRNNKGDLLESYINVDFVTSAAVNTGVVIRKELEKEMLIPNLMLKRIEKVLSLCVKNDNRTLILGAWGCGVFQNDPNVMAQLFYEQLSGKFKNQFKRVVFAIYSRNEKFINAFQNVFER